MRTEGYARPDTLEELFDVLEELRGEARIVAGGTDLMIGVRDGRFHGALVNISRVPELKRIEVNGQSLRVGATVTVAQLLRSGEVLRAASLLWQAADKFASPLVRSRATVGGNLCNASPAADLSLALLALDAEVEIASRRGKRTLAVDGFILGPRKTALAEDEIVTGVQIPIWSGRFQRFLKSGTRPSLEISAAALAVSLSFERDRVLDARVSFGAVAPAPFRARRTEAVIAGKPLSDEVIEAAALAAVQEVKPIDDVRASAIGRRRLVATFIRRALSAARSSKEGSVHDG